MCGFVSFFDNTQLGLKKDIIRKMADRIIHRGPDSDGYYVDKNAAIGFRRLSIIDLDGGDQPIFNEDRTKVLVFNGEIYNFKNLRKKLISKGHKFNTNSDAEVVLHGYEEYGNKVLDYLRGMFAFIIYDIKCANLFGARDMFGIKPCYFYNHNDTFIVCSEIKSMLEHPSFDKKVNKDALKMYLLFQNSVLDETFFKNVFKLKPGHYFEYSDGKLRINQYFKPEYHKQDLGYDRHRKQVEDALANSVDIHKISSDVEVGSYLSGGVDSSYVVCKAKPNKTFSVGFDVDGFDETKMAKDLSDIEGINNYSKYISKEEFFDALPKVQYYMDEPDANLSAVPLLYLSELASKQVKVVLSGEGSDEMFGGYNEYPETKFVKAYLKIPKKIRTSIAKTAKKFPHFPGQNTLIKYSKSFCERYWGHGQIMDEDEANEILNDSLKNDQTVTDVLKPIYDEIKDKDDVLKKMYIDMYFWLPQDILLKADKMTMANSLELRVPFLDKKVWDASSIIPTYYLVQGMRTKSIFRDIADDIMPDEWSNRTKLGFPVPFSKWIKEEKYYNQIKKQFNENYVKEFFDYKVINNMLDCHYKGKQNFGRKIYTVYMFLVWYKMYFVNES